MLPHSSPQNPDVNGMLTDLISGAVSSVLVGLVNHYVIKPVVQKGVDKMAPSEPLELTRTVEDVEDVEDVEVVEHEENTDDTK